jgi:Carboxypeptidase regulatory-like domain/TonB dependent receptor
MPTPMRARAEDKRLKSVSEGVNGMRDTWWLAVLVSLMITMGNAQEPQASRAELHGRITDGSGHPIAATIMLTGATPGAAPRVIEAEDDGTYRFPNLPAGSYGLQVQADGFDAIPVRVVTLATGERAEAFFSLAAMTAEPMKLSVDSAAEQMSGQHTGNAFEVTKRLVDNLPSNGRNYVQFTLTNSQVKRDTAPSISVLPTSGLSINGQRARFNLVNVDGGNAEDSVSNSIGSTVSQEAVQEFNILTSSFAPEYGQALGGVVNVVTRGGGNDWHGSAYAYLRNRNFAAANPLSNVSNPDYTRVQPGFVLGGPFQRDRSYFFLSYETTRRQETGFSSIGRGNFGLVNIDASRFFGPGAAIQGTPEQAAFLTNPLTPVNPATTAYAALVGGGSSIALTGAQPLFLGGSSTFSTSGAPLPASFTPLNALGGDFPVSEGTSIWSLRVDHRLTATQQLMVRATVGPSTIKGIQTSGPSGSTSGLTSFARSVQQQYRDFNILATHVTTMGSKKVNELRFLASRRGLGFTSATGSGADIGHNGVDIPGYAYFGEDPLSPISYIEKRFQGLDQFSWTHGSHSFKFGGEFIDIPISTTEGVQGGGNYVFGDTTIAPGLPAFPAVESYGLGLPLTLLQSIGLGQASFSIRRIGFFAQDSWKVNSRLKLDYGVRYDAEFNPAIMANTTLAAAGEAALGVRESVPFYGRAIAPRVGLAWDPSGEGKTVIKVGYGVFFDHPPSGVDAYAAIYDGSKVPLLLLTGGNPCQVAGGSANPFNLSATNTFQGTLTNSNCYGPLPGYEPSQQRFNPLDPGAIALFSQQGYLSAGVPLLQQPTGQVISSRFRYPYTQQASLQIERELGHDYIVSLGYAFNGGRHLFQPLDANSTLGTPLVDNWERAVAAGAVSPQSSPYAVATCGIGSVGPFAPAALLSFFRPSGINPSLTAAFAPCMPLADQVAAEFGLGTGNPGIPFSSMNALASSAASSYGGLTASLRRRMGKHYEFQTSYTWSHAIDNANDFYVNPQNNLYPGADRSNSSLDQRHRLVLRGMYQSEKVGDGKGWNHLLSDWTVAPLIEVGSGTPFNVLLGTSYAARPSIANSSSQTDLCGNTAVASRYSPTGYLIPPCSNDGVYDGVATLPFFGTLGRNTGLMPATVFTDFRVSRRIGLRERFHLDASADVFNVINRFNVSGVNAIYTQAGKPTAAYDPRVMQLGLKISW